MVLQERIELSTSPLPRECSTTELLQRPRLLAEVASVLPQAAMPDKRAALPGAVDPAPGMVA